jgi:Transposase DDE domain
MQNFPTASQPWQEVLDRLPPDLDLDALAFSSGALKRRREVGDGATLLRLAMARGPGGLSLNQTAAWAAMQGLAQLSDPAVKYRLDQAVPFLKALLEQHLAERAGGPPICWPGRSLRMVDGSHISQPGSQGSDWLIHAGYDLGGGGFFHLELSDKHGAESLLRGAPSPGEVRVGDRAFANAKELHSLRVQRHNQADFIVRAGWKALSQTDGAAFDLIAHLQSLPHDQQPHEVAVQAQVDKTTQLPLRLIILRFAPEETAKIHKRLRRRAQRQQKKLDPRTLVAAEFLILATSLPAELYPAAEVLAVYRLRWQIELAFKRLKSLLHIDRLPTRTAAASQSWLYAHLILALLCDELSRDFLAFSPSDLIDVAYEPSLWRVQKTALLLLVLAVLGPVPISCMLNAGPALHWQLANTRRKRKPAVSYPVQALF